MSAGNEYCEYCKQNHGSRYRCPEFERALQSKPPQEGPSSEKCQNEGCGNHSTLSAFGGHCSILGQTLSNLHLCHLFTTTSTTSIPTAELQALHDKIAELEAEVRAKDKQFRSCCVHGGNCAEPPPEYCPQCVNRDKATISTLDNIVKDLTEQCRYFHGQLADIEGVILKIKNWADAYPLTVFPEPDFKVVRATLAEKGITLDAVSASNMRHVINGVKAIIDKAHK